MSTDSAKNFAITGVAGYIAPRHLQAIKETGNHLVAAMDPHDSVGVIDRYFPQASFFCEFERFDRHLEMLRRKSPSEKIDYLSICSPNHLHDAHIRLALRLGADAICEKPLVINPWNLDSLEELEQETHRKVNSIGKCTERTEAQRDPELRDRAGNVVPIFMERGCRTVRGTRDEYRRSFL
jgi:UDP-N-acetyl-2-amino-2-deoxyglucuronate dehydrogenase